MKKIKSFTKGRDTISGDKVRFIPESNYEIHGGDSYTGPMIKCLKCGEWTNNVNATYCWKCGVEFKL